MNEEPGFLSCRGIVGAEGQLASVLISCLTSNQSLEDRCIPVSYMGLRFHLENISLARFLSFQPSGARRVNTQLDAEQQHVKAHWKVYT